MTLQSNARLLLIDLCGDRPSLALAEGDAVRASERLADRSAAGQWLPAFKRLLQHLGWDVDDLDAVGVVAGPGSFTGVRTGLAAAKGLCEAASLELAVVSRLALLAAAGGDPAAYAVLSAGRDQVYLRWPENSEDKERESLLSLSDLPATVASHPLIVTEDRVREMLSKMKPRWIDLKPEHLLVAVRKALKDSESDIAQADANYVRSEGEIYRKTGSSLSPDLRAL